MTGFKSVFSLLTNDNLLQLQNCYRVLLMRVTIKKHPCKLCTTIKSLNSAEAKDPRSQLRFLSYTVYSIFILAYNLKRLLMLAVCLLSKNPVYYFSVNKRRTLFILDFNVIQPIFNLVNLVYYTKDILYILTYLYTRHAAAE